VKKNNYFKENVVCPNYMWFRTIWEIR